MKRSLKALPFALFAAVLSLPVIASMQKPLNPQEIFLHSETDIRSVRDTFSHADTDRTDLTEVETEMDSLSSSMSAFNYFSEYYYNSTLRAYPLENIAEDWQDGDLQKILNDCSTVLQVQPQDAVARLNLAWAQFQTGNRGSALRNALQLAGNHWVYGEPALSYIIINGTLPEDFPETEKTLQLVLDTCLASNWENRKVSEDIAEKTVFNLASLLTGAHDYERALQTLGRIDIDASNPELIKLKSDNLIMLGRFAEDEAFLTELSGPTSPLQPKVVESLATLLCIEGKYKQAEKLLKRERDLIERQDPSDSPATILPTYDLLLGRLYAAKDKYGKALPYFESAVKGLSETALDPNKDYQTRGVLLEYVTVLWLAGQKEKAAETAAIILPYSRDESDEPLWLLFSGNRMDALRKISEPRFEGLHSYRASLFSLAGDPLTALDELRLAFEQRQTTPAVAKFDIFKKQIIKDPASKPLFSKK